jgi:DNA (cytosine-5)-methyltransferase 1
MRIGKQNKKKEPVRKVYAIDLFCGVGGLTRGLEKAGIIVNLGVDIDPACKYPYITNNKAHFLQKSVEKLDYLELASFFRKNGIRLLAGCAPCQTFSKYNQKANQFDKRWWLLKHFARLVKQIKPELVTMENVPGIVGKDVFKDFVKTLEKMEYHVSYDVVDCADYGIPQYRQRIVLLASLLGPIDILQTSDLRIKKRTVRQAIGSLPRLRAGEIDESDPFHQACTLSPINLRRIKASKPGGTWRDWKNDLVAECHKKGSGKTYPSVYGRMKWDEPAPTITTQFFGFGNGRFGHPQQDRAISLREGAILQSFPRGYDFAPRGDVINKKVIGRLIGNAVPVKIGQIIGKSIVRHVAEFGKIYRKNMVEIVKGLRMDTVDKKTRSKIMASVGQSDTGPEMFVRRTLHKHGLRYRLHDKTLPGSPDLVFPRHKAVVFVHGCFWHSHGCRLSTIPSVRRKFWADKFRTNKKRDRENIRSLIDEGWRVMVVWQCAIKKSKNGRLGSKVARWIRSKEQYGEIG